MNISVALTTYNGEKYIREQIESILVQLNENDEIIISDDGSSDSTIEILKEYAKKEPSIQLYFNKRLGVVKNFEFVIDKCTNDIIILSDQDDIWHYDKVKEIKKFFLTSDKMLLLHNAIEFKGENYVPDEKNEVMIKNMRKGLFINILKSCYWGCCIAFKKEFVEHILPFPKGVVAHDQWIGIVAESKKVSAFLDLPLIYHRLHQDNVTKKLSLLKKILFRVKLTGAYLNYRFADN